MNKMRSNRSAVYCSRWLAALAVLFCLSFSSCRFLADEFAWLDRAGPVIEPVDAPVEGVTTRP